MGFIEILGAAIKKQPGKRYRFVRLDPENVARRKFQGFEPVRKEDPAIKGTILEKHGTADGMITAGGVAIMQIPEDQARKIEKANEEKLKRRLDAIRENYQKSGEDIKRRMGSAHGEFNVVTEEKSKE